MRAAWSPGMEELWPSRALITGCLTADLPHPNSAADNPQKMETSKAVQARSCLHAAGPKQEMHSAGPVASDGHKAALWSMGLLRLSQDRCPFRSSGKLGLGPRGPLKGPIHSHSSQQHSRPCHSLSPGVPAGPANLWRRVHLQSQSQEERRELGVWDSPRSPDPFPLGVRARGIFGVGHGEATSSGLKLQSPLQKAKF